MKEEEDCVVVGNVWPKECENMGVLYVCWLVCFCVGAGGRGYSRERGRGLLVFQGKVCSLMFNLSIHLFVYIIFIYLFIFTSDK